jgi:hypothetical protein
MKKIFALLFGLMLVGAGCSGGTVEGDWYLAFDLPNDWIVTQAYSEGDKEEGVDVTRDHVEVFLQSADAHMIFSDNELDAETEGRLLREVLYEDMTRISVSRLDERRIIPSEAEGLGDGWYKLAPCAETPDDEGCVDDGTTMSYYLEADSGDKYLFRVTVDGQEISDAEEVLMTAEEVTITE